MRYSRQLSLISALLGLVIFLSFVNSMSFVGQDDLNYMIFSADKGVYRINPDDNKLFIDNALEIKLFPTIIISGKTMPPVEPRYEKPVIGSKMSEFKISYDNGFLNDVYANVVIKASDRGVEDEIDIENTKDTSVIVTIDLSDSDDQMSIYAPYVKDKNRKFIAFSPGKLGLFGRLDVVYFDPFPPSYQMNNTTTVEKPKDVLVWAVKIPAKQKYKLKLIILPGYLADSKALVNFPVKSIVDKEPFLIVDSDPLFEFYHESDFDKLVPTLNLNEGGEKLFYDIEKYVDKLKSGNPEFGMVSFIDWAAMTRGNYNSLEKSIILREICRKVGIPARLHIGKSRSGNYYAWVTAYVGGTKKTYDPFGKMADYPEIFKEGDPYICKDNINLCRFKGIIKTGIVCVGPFCFNVFLIAIAILVLTLSSFIVLAYKSEFVKRIFTGPPKRTLRVDGSYDITVTKRYDDPLINDIIEYMKKNSGLVDTDDMERRLGYSKILIISGIEKLLEDGIIRKR